MGRKLTEKPFRRRRLLLGVFILIAILAGYAAWTAWQIWTFLPESSGSADCAIVLGATLWDGKPSPAFKARIDHGVDLYQAGRVSKLLLSGGRMDGAPVSLAEAGRDYALRERVPPEDILVEPWSRITWDNLSLSRDVANAADLSTFLIVSDPLHMRRSMRMAQDLGMQASPSATPSTIYTSLRGRLWFLKRETWFHIQHVWLTRHFKSPTIEEAKHRDDANG